MKIYKVIIEDRRIEGSAEEILSLLKDKNFFVQTKSLNEFIQKVQHDIWRLYGISFQFNQTQPIPNQLMDHLLQAKLLKSFT